jgi:uncharacterized linocin/CFP29 family protein
MADNNSGLAWSEAQWEKVNNAVSEAFDKASVASAFLPCYGPLPRSAEYVRAETLIVSTPNPSQPTEKLSVRVQDDTTLKLFNLTVQVILSNEQVAEDALSSALLAFRRAANKLAQVEDSLVFNGRGAPRAAASAELKTVSVDPPPPSADEAHVVVSGESELAGLINDHTVPQIKASKARQSALLTTATQQAGGGSSAPPDVDGKHLVTEIANAIVELETNSHPTPFACILGAQAFVTAYTPETGGMVLPADRITPMLNGPLLRSGVMPPTVGVVVSLAGSDIDLVVATPPKAQFLQMTPDAQYLFRVYEKFMWRIKDPTAIHGISI